MKDLNRRRFLSNSLIGTGLGAGLLPLSTLVGKPASPESTTPLAARLPREVWIAAISLDSLLFPSPEDSADRVFLEAEAVAAYKPDFVVFPETFPVANLTMPHPPSFSDAAIPLSHSIVQRCSNFAKKHNCHLIAPILLRDGNSSHNSALWFDRDGNLSGRYDKQHLTTAEIDQGLTCGKGGTPVFNTDAGRIGIQICYDIEWDDGWLSLRRKGAEMVFWPSAFPGGRKVAAKAWQHQFVVVSSTWKGPARLVDMDGEILAETGFWHRQLFNASVNLEKAVVPTFAAWLKMSEITRKYGRRINWRIHDEEELTLLESLDPTLRIQDILQEFDLQTYATVIDQAP